MTFLCTILLASLLEGSVAGAPVSSDAAWNGAFEAGAADGCKEKEGEMVLARYMQASGKKVARGAAMVAHFAGSLPKMQKAGIVNAHRVVGKDGTVRYEIIDRRGDSTVWKELILRYINGEMENGGKDHSRMAVTPENYKFKFKGEKERDGRTAYVFEVSPRKKREGLFKGEIWVDAETALTVFETGRFVKSPSIFLKRVQFSREYAILDGVAVPKTMQTSIETRFWGPAALDIQFSDFQWEDQYFAYN